MTEEYIEEHPLADEWFQKTFDEIEELLVKRVNEGIEEGVPVHLVALASVAIFIGLLTKMAHHSGLDHDRSNAWSVRRASPSPTPASTNSTK